MFGLDKISFLICLGVTLLLTGLIIFFMRQKFAVYDRHITEQSQLLKHLVLKLENNIHTTNAMLASPSAVAAAKDAHKQFGSAHPMLNNSSKIIVSDDEESSDSDCSEDDDDASSSSSDDDSEMSEIDADNLNVNCKQIKLDEHTIGSQCAVDYHLALDDVDQTKTINLNTLDDLEVDEDSDLDQDSDDDSDDDSNDDISLKCDPCGLIENHAEDKITVVHSNIDASKDDIIDVAELNENEIETINTNRSRSLKQILLDDDSEIKISNASHKHNKKHDDTNESKGTPYLEFLEDELNLNDMKLPQLKELCKSRNLPTNGNKKELIERLTNK